jgi:hypothetical protein
MARKLWGFLLLILALGGLGAAGYLYRRLQHEEAARAKLAGEVAAFGPRFEQFKAAVRDVGKNLSATIFQEVDLAAQGWQPIAGGFYVIDLAAGAAPSPATGTRITGKVINPTSVTHESAQISVRIGAERTAFTLARVPPAVAQPFEVTLPNVAPADAHRAYFALDGSTISFASSTTRKRTGAEPVDTEKLLK